MSLALFTIGTSETDYVNLLDPTTLSVVSWEPAEGTSEDIYSSSALADYAQLTNYRETETAESLIIHVMGATQNDCIRNVTRLRQMLRKARDYWTSAHQSAPVYVSARASCESNTRYCIVYAGTVSTDGNPFTQPFVGSNLMADLPFAFTRGPWCDTPPGESECLSISGSQPLPGGIAHLIFDGINDNVNCGSGATIDDLPNGLPNYVNLSVEAWVQATGWGTGTHCYIFDKSLSGVGGWSLIVNSSGSVTATAKFSAGTALYTTSNGTFAADNQWHHIVAQLRSSFDSHSWVVAVDGHWVGASVNTLGSGNYITDAAYNLIIGNSNDGLYPFEGRIGWARVRTAASYNSWVDFTPPSRCLFPYTDTYTKGLWIRVPGSTVPDYSGNGNHGTIVGAQWDIDCLASDEIGQETTCLDTVYVGNKHNRAQITNIHYWDASAAAWSGNLFGAATPFAFMPPSPLQVNDVVVFGIDTSIADSGPFCSLVFDIATALDPGTGITIDWRYSRTGADIVTGPWPSFAHPPLQDNTNQSGTMTGDAFDTLGVNSVHWEQPNDWAAFNPAVNGGAALGTTGFWVAAIVTAAAGTPTPPIQQNRDIYSIIWPYITINEDEVSGDIPTWLTVNMGLCSAVWTQASLSMNTNQLWMGLRQVSRGENFSAYINFSDKQNPSNVIVSPVAPGAFGNNMLTPTGRHITYTPALTAVNLQVAHIQFTAPQEWYGRYHAFLRGQQMTGVSGDVNLRLAVGLSINNTMDTTSYHPFPLVGYPDSWIDFGILELNPRTPKTPEGFYIRVDANVSTIRTIQIYDLVLIPVDEWAANLGWQPNQSIWTTTEVVTLDGISKPVLGTTSQSTKPGGYTGTTLGPFIPEIRMNRDRPIVIPRSKQKIWFHADFQPSQAPILLSKHEVAHRVQAYRQQRYLSMRGDE